MHVACRAGNLAALEEYIGEFESLESRAKAGNTPLLTACMHGQEAIVAFLLEKGAKPDVVNSVRNLEKRCFLLISWYFLLFLTAHSCLLLQAEESALFLLLACPERRTVSEKHFLNLMSTLVQACPDINRRKKTLMKLNLAKKKMVNKAFGAADTKVVAKPRLYQEEGTTVLHIASVQGLVAVVKMILEAGAEVNALLKVSLFSLMSS